MTPAEQEMVSPATSPRRRWLLVILVAALFVAGAFVSYVGIRYQPLSGSDTAPPTITPADPVVRIDLPHEDFPVPSGPHRERFQVNCTVCHSPRLVFTQPPLPEQKWQEVVHKMVAVYGAPPTPEEEREIISYLSAVHGQTPP
jgi:hypothetical protein